MIFFSKRLTGIVHILAKGTKRLAGRGEELPKNKKRLATLSSRETPEQPSPRTAQRQNIFSPFGCKSHIGASCWHEMAIFQLLSIVDSRLPRAARLPP